MSELIPVDPSRVARGEWKGGKCIGEGEISWAYSADKIADGKPIRTPFRHAGDLWCCVSVSGQGITVSGEQEFQAYRLVGSQHHIDGKSSNART